MATVLKKATGFLAMVLLITFSDFLSCDYSEDSEERKWPPSAPYLFAEAISSSQIYLEWDDGYGKEDGFKIERYTFGLTDFVQIAKVGKKAKSFEDSDLLANTTYYYRIKAYNEDGDSDYSNSSSATTFLYGYGMCVNKTNGFACFQTDCGQSLDNASNLMATGAEVLNCLDLTFIAPATMTVYFTYKANAYTCYNQPYLKIVAGVQSETFFFNCTSTGEGSISIAIANGLTILDISFELFSGDWGSAVCIDDIVFSP